jgi:hypothetical protein
VAKVCFMASPPKSISSDCPSGARLSKSHKVSYDKFQTVKNKSSRCSDNREAWGAVYTGFETIILAHKYSMWDIST